LTATRWVTGPGIQVAPNIKQMLIKIGYNIALRLTVPTAVIFVLRVHPTRSNDLVAPENFRVEPDLPVEEYFDTFGNHCGRVNSPIGVIRFVNEAVVRDPGTPDRSALDAPQHDVRELPVDTFKFLLPSRYCEVDTELLDFAWRTFGQTPTGWRRVQAICDFVHNHIRFDYLQARANRTALDAFRERVGVCRDYTHLAITLCRCMNIPARYATGYLGDIGVSVVPEPMDFSAWFEVYLGSGWHAFDARHNERRIGRVLIGHGRDAGDVPITMAFGQHTLENFFVVTDEIRS